jgi:hypothetical protein
MTLSLFDWYIRKFMLGLELLLPRVAAGDLKTRIRDVITVINRGMWLTRGKNWNFDGMFSVRLRVPTLNCTECVKILCVYL